MQVELEEVLTHIEDHFSPHPYRDGDFSTFPTVESSLKNRERAEEGEHLVKWLRFIFGNPQAATQA